MAQGVGACTSVQREMGWLRFGKVPRDLQGSLAQIMKHVCFNFSCL